MTHYVTAVIVRAEAARYDPRHPLGVLNPDHTAEPRR
nr:hypothetical protein [Streptomyces oceani]